MKAASLKGSVACNQGWGKVYNFVKHIIVQRILLHGLRRLHKTIVGTHRLSVDDCNLFNLYFTQPNQNKNG